MEKDTASPDGTMDRRAFSRAAAFGLTGLALGIAPSVRLATGASAQQLPELQELRVDGARLNRTLAHLAGFGANEAGGIDRVAFSEADLAARAWVAERMEAAGLATSVDAAGNLLGRRPGTGGPGGPGGTGGGPLPPLMLGSHIDSVPGGGNYDGQVGSLAALEVARTLHDAGVTTRHPLEIAIFSNEEGGKTGSRAMAGEVEPRELDIVTASGFSIGEGIRRQGGDPERLSEVRRRPGSTAAFLELHVEQGAVLEAEGIDIGVVEGIVGIKRWNVAVEGVTNHAGTTPMDRRRDALVAAARFIDAVHTTALEMPGRQVATVGRVEAEPGAPNVIPGRVTLSLEIRDLTMDGIDRVFDAVTREAGRIGTDSGTTFSFDRFYTSRAAPTHPRIRDEVEAAAGYLGLSTLRMPSGAGHDAQSVAVFAPVGMIFVPSRAGVSHAPEELTGPQDVTNGADVLLRVLLALDRSGAPS